MAGAFDARPSWALMSPMDMARLGAVGAFQDPAADSYSAAIEQLAALPIRQESPGALRSLISNISPFGADEGGALRAQVPPVITKSIAAAKSAYEHPKDTFRGVVGGFFDPGGATTSLFTKYGGKGGEEVAKALERHRQASPGAAIVGDIANPASMVADVVSGVREGMAEAAKPKFMSRDEFFQSRRRQRPSLEEAISAAERDARDSSGVKAMIAQGMGKNARKAIAEAGERAKASWYEGEKNKGAEEKQLETDYKTYLQGANKQLEAENAKGFGERNPWYKTAVGAGNLAAIGTANVLSNVVAGKGRKLIKALEAAKESGDAAKIASATEAVSLWQKTLRAKQIAGIGAAASIPLHIRGIADVVDAYGIPATYYDAEGNIQPSLAQQRAAEHLKPWNFFADQVPAIATGIFDAYLGHKLARAAPKEVAQSMTGLTDGAITRAAALEKANAAATGEIMQARSAFSPAQSQASTGAFGAPRQAAQNAWAPMSPPPLPRSVTSAPATPVKPGSLLKPSALDRRIAREIPKIVAEDALSIFRAANPKATPAQLKAHQKAFMDAAKRNPTATVDEIATTVPVKGVGKPPTPRS